MDKPSKVEAGQQWNVGSICFKRIRQIAWAGTGCGDANHAWSTEPHVHWGDGQPGAWDRFSSLDNGDYAEFLGWAPGYGPTVEAPIKLPDGFLDGTWKLFDLEPTKHGLFEIFKARRIYDDSKPLLSPLHPEPAFPCRLGASCHHCNPPKRVPFVASVDEWDLLPDAP